MTISSKQHERHISKENHEDLVMCMARFLLLLQLKFKIIVFVRFKTEFNSFFLEKWTLYEISNKGRWI